MAGYPVILKGGEKVTATWLRELVECVKRITPVAGPGLVSRTGPNGTVLSCPQKPSPRTAPPRHYPFEVRYDPVYNNSFIIYLPGESAVSTDAGHCLTAGGDPVKILDGGNPLGQAYGPGEEGYEPIADWFQTPAPPSGAESFALSLAVYAPDGGSGDMKACLYWASEPPAVSNYSVFASARIAEVEKTGSVPDPRFKIKQLVVGAICLNSPAPEGGVPWDISPLYPLDGLYLVTGIEYPTEGTNAYKIVAHRVQLTINNGALLVNNAGVQTIDTVAHDSIYPNS